MREDTQPRDFGDQEDAFFVDCGIIYDGTAVSVITGLDHLEGEEVAIWGDGAVFNNKTVSGGQITLDQAVSKAHIGLPFKYQLKPMRLDTPSAQGATHGLIKKISKFIISFINTLGTTYGKDGGNMYTIDWRTEETYTNPPAMFTGDKRLTFDGGFDTEIFEYVVVYDPNDGFVTGGGWIDSPAGAYTPDPTLSGKATFGFVSKYKKGQQTPTGNTEFQFHAAGMNFHSDSYDWLVIAGAKAMYKGTGTINGSGNFGFMLSAIDEKLTESTDVDVFRIKIWDKDNDDEVIYDNQIGDDEYGDPTTAIANGQIVIHKS